MAVLNHIIILWHDVVQKLRAQGLTITTMESCTGGEIASQITSVSGASEVLKEAYVSYTNEAKIKFGVSAEIIEKYTVYSEETATNMAKAAKKLAKSNMAIGVTGQLGRVDPENPGVKENLVWVAIVDKDDDIHIKHIEMEPMGRTYQKEKIGWIVAKMIDEIL